MKHAQIVWFEIPVTDMDRAIRFYSSLLNITIEKHKMLEEEHAVLRSEHCGIGGVLVKREITATHCGVKLFFHVSVLSDAIETAVRYGGKVITPKTLLKQTDSAGNRTIAQNMIDNRVGYFAELLDSEGNAIALYSHF